MRRLGPWLAALLGAAPEPAGAAPEPAPVAQLTKSAMAPDLSAEDRDTVIRTLEGEAGNEPERGQVAVVHVIRNRALRDGISPRAVCLAPWQFSCWNAGDRNRARILALRAGSPRHAKLGDLVDRAWAAPDITGGSLHYYAPAGMPRDGLGRRTVPKWARGRTPDLVIGGHHFFRGLA